VIESVDFDAAVKVAVDAFCAGAQSPGDQEVWEQLTAAGVSPWLAERLVVFLPMAYVRRLLADVSFSDGLATPGARLALQEEPVYLAALARAQLAGREEIQRIALRGSEFDAVNNALKAGSQLSNLRLSETALVSDLEPVRADDGGIPSSRAVFEGLLRGHGVNLDGETAIDAELFVHPAPAGVVMAQIDFTVTHPALAGARLVESLAGHGATWRDAIGHATSKFERCVLHPIIEALLRPGAAADQVARERYEHPSGSFDLVLGPQLNLFTDRTVPPAGPLLDRLLETLRAQPLSRNVHALRLFTAHQDGQLQVNEVLLDSEQWAAGEAVVADSPAPLPDGMVAVRVFGLLVPTSGA
jgi:hypothetical protein